MSGWDKSGSQKKTNKSCKESERANGKLLAENFKRILIELKSEKKRNEYI